MTDTLIIGATLVAGAILVWFAQALLTAVVTRALAVLPLG